MPCGSRNQRQSEKDIDRGGVQERHIGHRVERRDPHRAKRYDVASFALENATVRDDVAEEIWSKNRIRQSASGGN